jgi:excisionase family DNA binding protein
LIEQLARQMSDKQVAAQLNRMAIKSAKGHSWTRTRVGNFRKTNAIANYSPGERQARGELTIEEAAKKLAVSYSTVQRMIKRRHLPGHQVCPGAPWIIRCEDVDALRAGGGHDKERHRAPSSGLPGQQTLAFP